MARDEIIQLKEQMVSTHAMTIPDQIHRTKPTALLICTSNVEGILEDRLKVSSSVDTTKVIKYTTSDTTEYLTTIMIPPTVLILQSLTNDLRGKNPQKCVEGIFDHVTNTCARWPTVKIDISSTIPVCDNINNTTNGQILNALLEQKFLGVDST